MIIGVLGNFGSPIGIVYLNQTTLTQSLILRTMLTKKEKLLVHPWVLQRYRSHRDKVESAGPAIDFRTPPTRSHVTLKRKMRQKELERKKDIEQENVRLLQKLAIIMTSTLRVDNFWKQPRPNFLSRENIYKPRPTAKSATVSPEQQQPPANLRGSAKRCAACSKTAIKTRSNQISPESRTPWAYPKTNWNRTLDFEPVVHICCRYCC